MASFFEKLIGGQDQDQPVKEKKSVYQKPARKVVKSIKIEKKIEEGTEEKEKEETEEISTKIAGEASDISLRAIEKEKTAPEKTWPETGGQLSIDVYQTGKEVVIESTIGGVKPENLEVTIENGMVQIKGNREKMETVEKDDYLIQECHWGSFSRQFVLPSEVDASRSEATLKNGILTIKIPRIQKEKVTKLMIK